MTTCAVSVIIPLFNAEKYIGECLLSVLASEFKDYEVIVIDDCSTDNSVAEVEKLLPHFDGRLKILSTEKILAGLASHATSEFKTRRASTLPL